MVAEPPLEDPPIPMLQALLESEAVLYGDIDKLVVPRATLQGELRAWNCQYCKV